MPTYHLANIVDDHLMEVTHVIRGEEWLPSAPLHILLYKAFGWKAPEFAHLPLLLKPEGNGKLSKRDGLLGNFPIFPLEWKDPFTDEIARGFKQDGYFPEAVVNFLAFLGWNPGTEQEIFSMDELIDSFTLDKIHKAGARFMVDKAKWFNQHYLKVKSDEELASLITTTNTDLSHHLTIKLVRLMKDRVTFPQEIVSEVPFIFEAPTTYDEEIVKSKWNDDARKAMGVIKDSIQAIENESFTSQNIHDTIFPALESAGIKAGKVMQAFRLVITGVGKGPDLMLTLEILGKEDVTKRIENAILVLN
jgi:glutamyl-tRNA synthetase